MLISLLVFGFCVRLERPTPYWGHVDGPRLLRLSLSTAVSVVCAGPCASCRPLPSPAQLPHLCLCRPLPSRPSFRGVCGPAHFGCSPSWFSRASLLHLPLAGPPPGALPPPHHTPSLAGLRVSPAGSHASGSLCGSHSLLGLFHPQPAPQADWMPDSCAHACLPQTEHLTLFRGDLPSCGSEAKQQEWPRALGRRRSLQPPTPHPPGLWLIQVYRPVHSEALSHVQIVSPWFFAEHCFLVTFS